MAAAPTEVTDITAPTDEDGLDAVFARTADAAAASLALDAEHSIELVGVEQEVGREFGGWLDVTLEERLHRTYLPACQVSSRKSQLCTEMATHRIQMCLPQR